MEHHIILTPKEATELCQKLIMTEINFVQDNYTGTTRTRTGTRHKEPIIKEYPIPYAGITQRFSAKCRLPKLNAQQEIIGYIENIWFEVKWTENRQQIEIEFEDEVPEEFKDRPNIHGWDVLKVSPTKPA